VVEQEVVMKLQIQLDQEDQVEDQVEMVVLIMEQEIHLQ
jgi:hypothetical protein